jgi:hypothetical protein
MSWFQDLKQTYFANPTAARDYRVQLRGNRSVMLFGMYLFVLIGVAFAMYTMQVSPHAMSVVSAQQQLHGFYQTVMFLLAGMIVLITPALTATTVITERQRHSFDLIFSAPVTPKQYLVGKMISSYRYTWMLLILSLPITASAVVLGGAAWSDVLAAYALLSLHALVFTAIALLMSTVAPRPVSAVMWAYAVVAIYLGVTGTAAAISVSSRMTGTEAFFMVAMNPFSVVQAADTYTTILNYEVPNWALALVCTLLVTRIVLLAAGSILSPYGGKESRGLRISGLAYAAAIAGIFGHMAGGAMGSGGSAHMPTMGFGIFLVWFLVPIVFVMPFSVCFGYEGERRHWPNGLFSPRHWLDGTPSGALPYLFALVATCATAVTLGVLIKTNSWIGNGFLAYVAYACGYLTLFWGVGRMASVTSGGLRQARTVLFAIFMVLFVVPVPFLSAIGSNLFSEGFGSVWNLWPFYPLTQDEPERILQVLGYGIAMVVGGAVLAGMAEARLAPKLRRDLIEDENQYARA